MSSVPHTEFRAMSKDISTPVAFANDFKLDSTAIRKALATHGYVVVTGVLSDEEVRDGRKMFHEWYTSSPQIARLHSKISTRGIFKHFGIGNTSFLWYTRTRKSVHSVYEAVHAKEGARMVTSFDGACYIPSDYKRTDNPKKSWVHTDQKPKKTGFACVQGYVSYTDNAANGRTTVLYTGSHKLFENYYNEFAEQKKLNKHWGKLDYGYLRRPEIAKLRTTVHVPAGAMLLWDSRTFHSTQFGCGQAERLVAYVCMLPKSGDTVKMAQKRKRYMIQGRTTNHLPYPIGVNGLQPRTFGNKDLLVDYDDLPFPGFKKYRAIVKKLI